MTTNQVPHSAEPALDIRRLEHVHPSNGKTIAQCPACAEIGGDKSGNHLSIFRDGRFACVLFPNDKGKDHRRRIFELVGQTEQPRPMMPPPDDSKRAYAGTASPREAIKAKRLECVCFCETEVRLCTSPGCPLWEYRPFQTRKVKTP